MPDKVLIYSRFPKAMMARIGQRFELMDAAGKPPHEVFTAEQLSGVRAMITAGSTPLGGAMMDKLPSLRAIVCYGTGYDGVDMAAAAQRKITVGHSPAANAAAVADLAVTLMLAVTRRLLPADNYVRSGNWSSAKPSPLMRPQPGNPGRRVDVYRIEPHAPDALTAFPNVVLTPHVGGHTLDSHTAMQDCVIANLEAFFAGKALPFAVRGA